MHPNLKLSKQRLQETADFLRDFLGRLECIASTSKGKNCPANLAANTHREGVSLFDILQPAYAGLYSGAIHPTAEGHSIVADHMVRHVRTLIDKRTVVENVAR